MSQVATVKGSDNAQKGQDFLDKENLHDLEVIVATDLQLLLDYDSEEIPPIFDKVINILKQRVGGKRIEYQKFKSRSGKHWHVVIDLPSSMDLMERVAWQAAFGSDSLKESLTLLGISLEVKNPVLLFMGKYRTAEVHIVPDEKGRKFRTDEY